MERAALLFAVFHVEHRCRTVLTDNGSCYRSRLWRDTPTDAGITRKPTRPYLGTETERREALPRQLHPGNHHRGHTAPHSTADYLPAAFPTSQATTASRVVRNSVSE